ncbi:MAG: ubiquinol-cytochrome C chaperone family protein [Pseudomonadota bacterium]|nr:ubiquinol-cytochrome C chaperone family protein [Pseudomonadota bacterium]
MIVLHLFFVISCCQESPEFCRQLSETFFADMDRSLREMGVGDTGVGHRVKNMAQAFYGRLKAYENAGADAEKWQEALKRNVLREKPVSDESIAALAEYALKNRQLLQAQPAAALSQGKIAFSH